MSASRTTPDNPATSTDAANNPEYLTEPIPEFTEISQYRHDRGRMAWAWRCWGDGACDGWLGLDHETERWARVTLQRHLREDHRELTRVRQAG